MFLLTLIGLNWVLLGFNLFDRVLPSFMECTGFYMFLLTLIGFNWVFVGLNLVFQS